MDDPTRRQRDRHAPPIRDDAALLERARALVQEGLVRRLWILLIRTDGTMLRELQQVDGIPVSPDAFAVAGIAGILGIVAPPGIDVAFVVERPGRPLASPDDWAWHDAIVGAARARDVRLRGVLLAHGLGVDRMEPGAGEPG